MNKEIKESKEIKLSVNYIKYIEYIKDIKKNNNLIDNVKVYDKVVNKRFSNKKRVFNRMNNFINSVNKEDIKNIFNIDKKELLVLIDEYKNKNKVSKNIYYMND